MNSNELESVLKNESLDVLQKLFDYMAEELSIINKEDKIKLEKINNELEEKFEILKQEFKKLESNRKNKISKELTEYIFARDYIGAYYNQKYFKERSKNRNKTSRRSNKIKEKASVNLMKTLAFSMKKYVYLIVIHKIKWIYAKSHAFRLLNGVSITPCSCKIIQQIILTG